MSYSIITTDKSGGFVAASFLIITLRFCRGDADPRFF